MSFRLNFHDLLHFLFIATLPCRLDEAEPIGNGDIIFIAEGCYARIIDFETVNEGWYEILVLDDHHIQLCQMNVFGKEVEMLPNDTATKEHTRI